MKVIQAIGLANYNTGNFVARADPIPVGAIVSVRWEHPGIDSYGNTVILAELGLSAAQFLAPYHER